MPLYEYECTVCGERTEVIQRLSDPPLSDCPKCREPVRKLLSAPSFQFKGSGWYVTDYAGKSSGGKSEPESKGTKDTSSSSEAKPKKESSSDKST